MLRQRKVPDGAPATRPKCAPSGRFLQSNGRQLGCFPDQTQEEMARLCSPTSRDQTVGLDCVKDWISLMQKSGLRRACCLLPCKQLAYYQVDLLAEYCKAFGEPNVCRAEIEDFTTA